MEEGKNPSEFLLVTFTRTTAADQVRELSKLEVQGSDQVKTGILHSFCFSTLENVPQLFLVPKNLLLFEFKALSSFLFWLILNCWTVSIYNKKSFMTPADTHEHEKVFSYQIS